MIILFYVIHTVFTASFALYFKYQLLDEADGYGGFNKNDSKWHFWGSVMRGAVIALIVFCALEKVSVYDALLSTSIQVALYDILVNVIALEKPILYPGKSSWYDKFMGRKKWIVYVALIAVAAIAKATM